MFSIRSNIVRERPLHPSPRPSRHHQHTLSEDGTLFMIDRLRRAHGEAQGFWRRLLRFRRR